MEEVLIQYFQSVIAIELGVAGALPGGVVRGK
jgi:hypothetical protein